LWYAYLTAYASSASKKQNPDLNKSSTSTANGNLLRSSQIDRTHGGKHKKLTKAEILQCEESIITIPNLMADEYSKEYELLIKTSPLLEIPFNAVCIKAINSNDKDTL
jgi:hypothetical protein